MTKKQAIKEISMYSNITENLVKNVINQFDDKFKGFLENYKDISSNCIQGGYKGFISTHDLCSFFNKNRKDIFSYIRNRSKSIGLDAFQVIKNLTKDHGFSIVDIADTMYNYNDFYGAPIIKESCVWMVAQAVCDEFCDIMD